MILTCKMSNTVKYIAKEYAQLVMQLLPRCELRLGDRQRASIIADEWREHCEFWAQRMEYLSLKG